jgi:hypothetical protein
MVSKIGQGKKNIKTHKTLKKKTLTFIFIIQVQFPKKGDAKNYFMNATKSIDS